jgi:hypothetical protein
VGRKLLKIGERVTVGTGISVGPGVSVGPGDSVGTGTVLGACSGADVVVASAGVVLGIDTGSGAVGLGFSVEAGVGAVLFEPLAGAGFDCLARVTDKLTATMIPTSTSTRAAHTST